MASGHVNRANRPNTWPQPTSCTAKKTLANKEPSTHGTTLTSSAESSSADVAKQRQREAPQAGPAGRVVGGGEVSRLPPVVSILAERRAPPVVRAKIWSRLELAVSLAKCFV